MKNRLLYWAMLAFAALWMSSCDDDSTAGMTRITYYPELTLEGATKLYLDKGTSYVEPGYSAELNGENVTDQVNVVSNVNTANSGVYSISYTIVNADGFSKSASRTVIVTDPNDAAEGVYYTDPNSYRLYEGTQTAYGGSYEILVLNKGDGTYHIDDLLGGWYAQRAGYGSDYAMSSDVTINADGTIELESSLVLGWGDCANELTEGYFDAATGTMSWNVSYTDYPFNFYVTMYKR